MKQNLTLLICAVLLAVLIHCSVSLPPDFFRNGRGHALRVPPHKKSTPAMEVLSAACNFCRDFFGDEAIGWECRQGLNNRRRDCVEAFIIALENALDNNQREWTA